MDMETNERHYCILPEHAEARVDGSSEKAAVLTGVKWGPGAEVKVRFLEGDARLRERVRKAAVEWMDHANVNLVFVDEGPTDIRIAFQKGNGSWSYLGTDCRRIAQERATMNYGWLTADSPEAELRRVVLHEFGHALGMPHEHQVPEDPIRWNVDAVVRDLSGPPNHWDRATIEANIFKTYDPQGLIASSVDRESIMMYPIPKAWTRDGFSAGLNTALSRLDKEIIGIAYPR